MKNFSKIYAIVILTFCLTQGFGQNQESIKSVKDPIPNYKFSAYSPYLTFTNFGDPKTNTQHYEFGFRYALNTKDIIGIKVATWKLFAPMGIPFWDSDFLEESAFYPGRVKESGIGITYQRILWKGLFASVEVLPIFKTYLNEENVKVGNGFKLYNTFHIGYHFPLFKGRFYIEPQLHFNYWPIDTNTPEEFRVKEIGTNNFFYPEPNLYLGIKF